MRTLAYLTCCAGLLLLSDASAMTVTSSDFVAGALIPFVFSCKGQNVPPNLVVDDAPSNVASLALVVVDPDAPSGHFVHWVVWNIPAKKSFSEAIKEGSQGINDAGNLGYSGPCPPSGQTHDYIFRVYALDTVLSLPDTSSRDQLEDAMKGHIIGSAELRGTFQSP